MAYVRLLIKQFLQHVLAQCPLLVIQLKAKPSMSVISIARVTALALVVSSVMCLMRLR